jgi:hypothetical protein
MSHLSTSGYRIHFTQPSVLNYLVENVMESDTIDEKKSFHTIYVILILDHDHNG